ncbi:MAG: glucose-6-phosphate isomerase [Bdellovibrionaceae bacterium]|nr:glucose-6-phosphate isomerase [Pseudobdellovibrionaceae bacterium]
MWHLEHETVAIDGGLLQFSRESVSRLQKREDLGFLKLAAREPLWTASEQRGRDLRRTCKSLVVLGMGGSSLGGRAVLQALGRPESTRELIFIDNVDSDRFWSWLKSRKDFDEVHWAIVSKSGNTIETLTMAEAADQYLRASGFKKLSANTTVISETDDNPLMRWARKEGVATLEIPKDVGGRFSVLSPVGMFPAAFYGLDIQKFRSGATWALGQDDLCARLVAHSLASFRREEWITLFWSYADGLREFGLWTQQLWAESLGKRVARDGKPAPRASTPIPAIGSSDQHSILQQVMEGARDKFVWFFRVGQSEEPGPVIEKNLFDCQALMQGKGMGQLFQAMAEATREALAQQSVQSLTLKTQRLDEESLGALFMLMQLTVGAVGEALDINAFDQPGVELGKTLAKRSLLGSAT